MAREYICVNARGRRIGEDHHRAKLSNADIDLILELRDEGMSLGAIARKMDHVPGGIGKSTVRDICTGRIRAQLPADYKRCDSGGKNTR